MKKRTKIIIITIILLVITSIGIGIGGKMYMDNQAKAKHEKLVEFVKTYATYEKMKRYFDSDKVEKITIDYDSVDLDPAGSVDFKGYINGDKSLNFQIGINYDEENPMSRNNIGKINGGTMAVKTDDFLNDR